MLTILVTRIFSFSCNVFFSPLVWTKSPPIYFWVWKKDSVNNVVMLSGNSEDIVLLQKTFFAWLFSEKSKRYCYSLGVVVGVMRKLWNFVYLCYYWRYVLETWKIRTLFKEKSILSRETIHFFFLQNYIPFLTWTFSPLSSTQQPSIGTCMVALVWVLTVLLTGLGFDLNPLPHNLNS